MLLGFALTEHCNLRCPHCIRDDVTTVRSLDAALVESVLDQAIALYGSVTASFTGAHGISCAKRPTSRKGWGACGSTSSCPSLSRGAWRATAICPPKSG